jgi:flagellar protein FlbT
MSKGRVILPLAQKHVSKVLMTYGGVAVKTMALKIRLKPKERVIIGCAVVTNGNNNSDLIIENNIPILREKDIMNEEDANTPCRRIYFVIQLMYVDENNMAKLHNTYWQLVRDVVGASPSTILFIDQISQYILSGQYYKALKVAHKLIDYEQEVVKNVYSSIRSI